MSSRQRRSADDPPDSVELDNLGEVDDPTLAADDDAGEHERLLRAGGQDGDGSEPSEVKRFKRPADEDEDEEEGVADGLGEDDMADSDMDAIVRKVRCPVCRAGILGVALTRRDSVRRPHLTPMTRPCHRSRCEC